MNRNFKKAAKFILILNILLISSCFRNKSNYLSEHNSFKSLNYQSKIYKNIRDEILRETGLKGELKKIIDRRIMKVCLRENNYPFSYAVESKLGEKAGVNFPLIVEGFEVDIARKIAQVLNVKANLIFSQEGCDLVFNPSVPEKYLLTEPYFFQPSIFCEKRSRADGCKGQKSKSARKQLSKDWLYIGIKKNEKELKKAIDLIIEHLNESGTYNNIFKKWFRIY